MAIKLYVALIWRCSGEPHNTDILARRWAALLGLEEPNTLGARRITTALNSLEQASLVRLERRRGDSTIVTLREESGTGAEYVLPSTAHSRGTEATQSSHRYFKLPLKLWTHGHIQGMSAAAIAMTMVLTEERNVDGRPTWWSTERFPQLFNLTPSIRSRGTAELAEKDLIVVRKQLVDSSTNPAASFSKQRVRNLYQLAGDARPLAMIEKQEEAAKARRDDAPNRSGKRKLKPKT
ncbi:hypothetical protein [Nocardioides rubriscoriae]|uniref:hypothetical protein n=1 Tax=Nocardioides rubriscoriae TaxID=642762 RepID=UPI0011DF0832|nr:hypothetical protein [Nocardioides rubriscoriae]